MKTIGLIGGMSWESTAEYYRIINEQTNRRLGEFHSARIIVFSIDFDQIAKCQHEGRWADATVIMVDACAGADLILICTNTMHKMANEVQSKVGIPLVHIVDAVAEAIKSMRLRKIGLLGTKFTMEQDF
jgi:aspartate racemase